MTQSELENLLRHDTKITILRKIKDPLPFNSQAWQLPVDLRAHHGEKSPDKRSDYRWTGVIVRSKWVEQLQRALLSETRRPGSDWVCFTKRTGQKAFPDYAPIRMGLIATNFLFYTTGKNRRTISLVRINEIVLNWSSSWRFRWPSLVW